MKWTRLFLVMTLVVWGSFAPAEEKSDFPEILDAVTAQQTASYNCLGQCALTYLDRYTGAQGTIRIDVGPSRVTVGSPSEDAIHAAAQVALTPMCTAACDANLPSGKTKRGCRLYGTGPCSRIH